MLVDADRTWVKARVGCDWAAVPRADSFCSHVVHGGEPVLPADPGPGPVGEKGARELEAEFVKTTYAHLRVTKIQKLCKFFELYT